jgi:hypothetical protein
MRLGPLGRKTGRPTLNFDPNEAVVAQAETESPPEACPLRAGLTFARMVAHSSASAMGVIV